VEDEVKESAVVCMQANLGALDFSRTGNLGVQRHGVQILPWLSRYASNWIRTIRHLDSGKLGVGSWYVVFN